MKTVHVRLLLNLAAFTSILDNYDYNIKNIKSSSIHHSALERSHFRISPSF